jgi:hypothetical protein
MNDRANTLPWIASRQLQFTVRRSSTATSKHRRKIAQRLHQPRARWGHVHHRCTPANHPEQSPRDRRWPTRGTAFAVPATIPDDGDFLFSFPVSVHGRRWGPYGAQWIHSNVGLWWAIGIDPRLPMNADAQDSRHPLPWFSVRRLTQSMRIPYVMPVTRWEGRGPRIRRYLSRSSEHIPADQRQPGQLPFGVRPWRSMRLLSERISAAGARFRFEPLDWGRNSPRGPSVTDPRNAQRIGHCQTGPRGRRRFPHRRAGTAKVTTPSVSGNGAHDHAGERDGIIGPRGGSEGNREWAGSWNLAQRNISVASYYYYLLFSIFLSWIQIWIWVWIFYLKQNAQAESSMMQYSLYIYIYSFIYYST